MKKLLLTITITCYFNATFSFDRQCQSSRKTVTKMNPEKEIILQRRMLPHEPSDRQRELPKLTKLRELQLQTQINNQRRILSYILTATSLFKPEYRLAVLRAGKTTDPNILLENLGNLCIRDPRTGKKQRLIDYYLSIKTFLKHRST